MAAQASPALTPVLPATSTPTKPPSDYSEEEIKALVDTGRLAEAETVLRARLAAHRAADRAETALAASDAELLAWILVTTKRAAEAEPLMRAALGVRERIGDAAPTGRALNRLASVMLELRRYDEAEGLARRAIDLLLSPGAKDDRLVAAWGNLGRSLDAQDRLGEAVRAFEQGTNLGRATFGADHPVVGTLATLLAEEKAKATAYAERSAKQRQKLAAVTGTKGRETPDTARELYLLSIYLKAEGAFEEAETVAEQAYDIQAVALGRDHADTRAALYHLTTLLRRDAAARAASDPQVSVPPPAIAARRPDPAKAPDAYTEGEIRALIDTGRFVDLEPVARARVARHARLGAAGTAAAATDMELLANILYLTGATTEAEASMRDAIGVRERIGDRKALATATRRLALVLSQRGDYRTAEPLARRAIDLTAALDGETRALSAAWGTLGEILAGQRRRPEASAALLKAIEFGKAALGDEDSFVIEEVNSYALNLEEMGKLAEAEAIYRRNLDVLTRSKGRGSLDVARSLSLLSTNLDRQKRDLEAEMRLRQAIAIREKILGPNNPDTLRSFGNLVGLLTRAGKSDDAAALQARVIRLRATLPDRSVEESVADLGRMGAILIGQGKREEAIDYQRRALALAKEGLDPGHAYVAVASVALARSLARHDPASSEYVSLMRSAVDRARSERARVLSASGVSGSSPGERAVAAALSNDDWSDTAGSGVFALALTLYANHATQVRSEEAKLRAESFMIAQDAVSSASTRALAGIAAREALGDTPLARLVRRQQDLAKTIRDKDRALAAAIAGTSQSGPRLKQEIAELGRDLADVGLELRRAYPGYARLVAPRSLTEKEVRGRLRPGEALLLVAEGELYDFTYVVTKEDAGWHAVPRLQSFLKGTIEAFRCEVDPATCSGIWTASPLFERRYAWDLYRFLVQPHEDLLKDVKTLYVATSGPLSDLPFTAFITEEPQGPDTETALTATPWLSDRFAIVNLPSVATLRAIDTKRPKRHATPFIGYGAPRLASAGKARAVTAGLAPRVTGAEQEFADPERLRALPSLPGTAVELNAMARLLKADTGAIRLGPDATEAAVRADPRLKDARIIAFATHGILPGEIEGFAEPGLIFTPPVSPSMADDGILAASEAAALDLSASWLILSACNTATAEGAGGGDALSALAQAFLYAGADALFATRWRVGDRVTAALTVETLANAERDPRAGRAAAFQSAMRAIRTGKRDDGTAVEGWNSDWAHPAAWAPFALIANGN